MSRCLLAVAVLLALAGCGAERAPNALRAGKDIAVVMDLRALHTAQTQFAARNGRFGTLAELRDAGVIDAHLATGRKHGYVITLVSADAKGFAIQANPDAENKLSYRYYYIDQTGVLRLNHSRPARPSDPPASM